MTARIRPASASDAAAIAALSAELGYPREPGDVARALEPVLSSPEHRVLVAEAPEGLAGWAHTHVLPSLLSGFRAELLGLVVASTQRRSGVGRALVGEAEAWAAARGASEMVARSDVRRTESHHFYPSLGYAATKTQAVYRKGLAP